MLPGLIQSSKFLFTSAEKSLYPRISQSRNIVPGNTTIEDEDSVRSCFFPQAYSMEPHSLRPLEAQNNVMHVFFLLNLKQSLALSVLYHVTGHIDTQHHT